MDMCTVPVAITTEATRKARPDQLTGLVRSRV
jgi:hypothetical protein